MSFVSTYLPLPETYSIFTATVVSAIAYIIYTVASVVIAYRSAPIRDLCGPKSVNWFTGSYEKNVREPDGQDNELEWIREYGHVFRYYGLFNRSKIHTTDLRALNHIINAPEFGKSDILHAIMRDSIGSGGLPFVQGSQHKRQRRIMNLAFGLPQIKEYSQLFVKKANELRDALIAETSQSPGPVQSARVDIFLWLTKITLDTIGEAGFNHSLRPLYLDGAHDLVDGLNKFAALNPFSVKFLIGILFPPARLIPTDHSLAQARVLTACQRLGKSLISQKKAEILATAESDSDAKGRVEKRHIPGHNLLSLLMKANMATDIADSSRMNDEEILAQVPTFLIVGHESSTAAATWTIYALSKHPAVHAKLNAEARAFHTDAPTMDELNGMTYLDYVIREALRLYPPVPLSERVAKEDTVVPLSEPFIDRHGVKRHEFRVRKGDIITIPILVVHRLKSLWGEDADEFRPERWEAIPEAVKDIPGVFSNLLTFFSGVRGCIGYRFAITEIKMLVFTLVRSFDFELAVPSSDIIPRTTFLSRPVLSFDTDKGPQLPLILRPAKSD